MNATVRRFLPEIVVAVLVGAGYGIGVSVGTFGGMTEGLATVGSIALVPAVRRYGGPWEREFRLLFFASLLIGVVSVATGLGSNATDEPYTMWGYLAVLLHGHDPYTTTAMITFTVHTVGVPPATHSGPFNYVYLPLLLFFQVPGTGATGYKAMCVACWVGIVYLLRHDRVAALCLVSPMACLVAANGFTDLPVLLLMTFALRGPTGATGKVAEYASYAMKQFANLFWVALYLARRDLLRAGLVVVLTLALCSPFLLWHPSGIWCSALALNLGPGCSGGSGATGRFGGLYLHWNYYLWVLWVYALYSRELGRTGRRAWRWFRVRAWPSSRTA